MLRAAFTSRSWIEPHASQHHSLIPRSAIPFGREGGRLPHSEQTWEEKRSDTSRSMPPLRNRNFHDNMSLKRDQPTSSTLFAWLVRASFDELTSPTTISPYSLASLLLALWRKSLRRLAILQ
jgi:hypothetical protein